MEWVEGGEEEMDGVEDEEGQMDAPRNGRGRPPRLSILV